MELGTATLALGVFNRVFESIENEKKRKHERKMAEIQLITTSTVRDEYAKQLYLDRFLSPIEKAQKMIQDASKHAQ